MKENHGYIKAMLKTHERLVMVYPDAEIWGKPLNPGQLFPSADEVILPYLGKKTWLKKKRLGLGGFFYEIKDTDRWVVLPDWIEYFDSQGLVPPAKWEYSDDPFVVDDIWLDYFEERYVVVVDLIIITG